MRVGVMRDDLQNDARETQNTLLMYVIRFSMVKWFLTEKTALVVSVISFPELDDVSNLSYCKIAALLVSAGWVVEHTHNQEGARTSSAWFSVRIAPNLVAVGRAGCCQPQNWTNR